jgi:uncharacterized protein (UPF0264 family)
MVSTAVQGNVTSAKFDTQKVRLYDGRHAIQSLSRVAAGVARLQSSPGVIAHRYPNHHTRTDVHPYTHPSADTNSGVPTRRCG